MSKVTSSHKILLEYVSQYCLHNYVCENRKSKSGIVNIHLEFKLYLSSFFLLALREKMAWSVKCAWNYAIKEMQSGIL